MHRNLAVTEITIKKKIVLLDCYFEDLKYGVIILVY